MADMEKNARDYLNELAVKLTASAHQLSEAARRLQLAELTYREYLVRLRKLDEQMRNLMNAIQNAQRSAEQPPQETNPFYCEPQAEHPAEHPPEPDKPVPPKRRKLRYADYLEFTNYSELKKFEKMDEISDDEVKKFNADEAFRELLDDKEGK